MTVGLGQSVATAAPEHSTTSSEGGELGMEAPSAGMLLERAFSLYQRGQHRAASSSFRAAIATGNLNDAGRALAYWHVYLAERDAGSIDASADALASFVVVADDVLEARRHIRYAVDETGDFVDRFDLPLRLSRARAILSATWAERSGTFGRSEESPVPVRDPSEIIYFLELAPPCGHSAERKVEYVPSSADSGLYADADDALQHVRVSCNGGGRAEYYFMITPEL